MQISSRLPVYFPLLLLAAFPASIPLVAQAQSEAELLRLCSKFPYNSLCEGRDPVVLLSDRPGEKVENCKLRIGLTGHRPFKGPCKVEQTDGGVNVYIAEDAGSDVPDDELYSTAVSIPRDRLIATTQTYATRAGGGFGPDVYSITQLSFFKAEPKADGNLTNVVRIQANRRFGEGLAEWLNENFEDQPQNAIAQQLQATSETDSGTDTDDTEAVAANVKTLLETRACLRCNLQGADLSGQDLGLVNLEGANLSGANLSGTNLGESYIMGAVFDRADLSQSQLSEAWGVAASFVEADLTETKLHNVHFWDTNFEQAKMPGAKLDRLNESTTILTRASFQEANLENSSFEGANLTSANFSNANLQGANLSREPVRVRTGGFLSVVFGSGVSSLEGNQDFSTFLKDANFSGANLKQANLHYAQMENVDLSNADLSEAELNKSYLVGANLSNSNLQSSRMTYINLSDANLEGANITGVNFDDSNFCGATMSDGSRSDEGCR